MYLALETGVLGRWCKNCTLLLPVVQVVGLLSRRTPQNFNHLDHSGMVGGRMYLPSIFDLGKTGEPQFSLGY